MIIFILFIANAAILIIEIVGARALAPFLGTSTEVWAGIIATVLAGLTVGYHFGGRFADTWLTRGRNLATLAAGLVLAAGFSVLIAWSLIDTIALLGAVLAPRLGLTLAACTVSLIAFVPPAVCLAALSPVVARMRLTELSHAAATIGSLSAVAAAGSIIGSLAAGMLLIPYFGSRETLIGTGLLLCILGAAYGYKTLPRTATVTTALCIALLLGVLSMTSSIGSFQTRGSLLADIDTKYQRIWILDGKDRLSGAPIRSIHTDPFGTQCSMFERDIVSHASSSLVFSYTQAFAEVLPFIQETQNSTSTSSPLFTVVGGCNFSFPRYLSEQFPTAVVTVSELDAKLIELSEQFFGFVQPDTMRIETGDARFFFASRTEADAPANVIFYDAFNSFSAIPHQLITKEALSEVQATLSDDGVLVMNVIGGINGPTGNITASIFATVSEVFENVSLYQLRSVSYDTPQNLILIASKQEIKLDETTTTFSKVHPANFSEGLVLLDNFAPVERLSKPVRAYILGM